MKKVFLFLVLFVILDVFKCCKLSPNSVKLVQYDFVEVSVKLERSMTVLSKGYPPNNIDKEEILKTGCYHGTINLSNCSKDIEHNGTILEKRTYFFKEWVLENGMHITLENLPNESCKIYAKYE